MGPTADWQLQAAILRERTFYADVPKRSATDFFNTIGGKQPFIPLSANEHIAPEAVICRGSGMTAVGPGSVATDIGPAQLCATPHHVSEIVSTLLRGAPDHARQYG